MSGPRFAGGAGQVFPDPSSVGKVVRPPLHTRISSRVCDSSLPASSRPIPARPTAHSQSRGTASCALCRPGSGRSETAVGHCREVGASPRGAGGGNLPSVCRQNLRVELWLRPPAPRGRHGALSPADLPSLSATRRRPSTLGGRVVLAVEAACVRGLRLRDLPSLCCFLRRVPGT
jgi:hypothetical protein